MSSGAGMNGRPRLLDLFCGAREGTSMSDERVLVDRDDLRAVLPTMKAPDPYFQPAEHDEWLAAFKRVQATLDAGVPVQQDKPDAMPALRDRIAEALWRLRVLLCFLVRCWALRFGSSLGNADCRGGLSAPTTRKEKGDG